MGNLLLVLCDPAGRILIKSHIVASSSLSEGKGEWKKVHPQGRKGESESVLSENKGTMHPFHPPVLLGGPRKVSREFHQVHLLTFD